MSAHLQPPRSSGIEVATGDPAQLPPAPQPERAFSAAETAPPRHAGPLLRAHLFVKEMEPWNILLAVVALCLSLVTFYSDHSDRIEERRIRAWQLLMATAPGNSGKREALKYLNKEDGWICGQGGCWVTLKPRTELVGIKLGAYYGEDESGVLRGAVFLRGVQLPFANLAGADLQGAILEDADLSGADLSGAILRGANLQGAILDSAKLSGADLTNVAELTQEQVDEACGDASTQLPDGLTIRPCK